jgi:hypothetical protein
MFASVAALCHHDSRECCPPQTVPVASLTSPDTALPTSLQPRPDSNQIQRQDRRVSSSIPARIHGVGGVRVQSYAGSYRVVSKTLTRRVINLPQINFSTRDQDRYLS